MKTVTSINNSFISVAILPTDSNSVSDPIAFTLRTQSHTEVLAALEKLIELGDSETGYFSEQTIDVADPFYGNIKFHKYNHAYVSIVANYCSAKFVGDLSLLKPVAKQLRKWIEQTHTKKA